MADKRLISSDIFTDEFYISLDMLGRNLWIGLIITADDQGRIQDNPALIRSKIFPADDIPTKQISKLIDLFVSEGKLHRYEKGGKKLLQIVNWWKHQNPQYPAESIYPAPDNWVDRVRQKGFDNKMVQSNWDKRGGFGTQDDPQLGTQDDTQLDTQDDTQLDTQDDTQDDPQLGTQDDPQLGTQDDPQLGYPIWRDENENENENELINSPEIENSENSEIPEKATIATKPKIKPKPKKEIPKQVYGEFENVRLTGPELEKLKERFPDGYLDWIETLSRWKASNGKKKVNDYATILAWERREQRNRPPEQALRETKTWTIL